MRTLTLLAIVFYTFALSACNKPDFQNKNIAVSSAKDLAVSSKTVMPNILLLVADDVGYEIPTYTGGERYQTPHIDSLAWAGRQFTDANSCPNCSPSRQSFLTGKYNNQNYLEWGTLDRSQKTIANMLRNAGYATAISGKWQLDGGDAAIKGFGFNDYLVFLPFNNGNEKDENKGRYRDPVLYKNGAFLPSNETKGKYADDMFVDFTSRFIDSVHTKTSKPFFVYHSFSLCHMPFTPTPDDPQYITYNFASGKSDSTFFTSMVKYMNKEVGKLMDTLKKKNLINNTIVIFYGDNGTASNIHSPWRGMTITGGKNKPTQYGTHVPFIVAGGGVTPGIKNNIIDFTDLLPTLADIAGIPKPIHFGHLDGLSFYGSIYDLPSRVRDTTFLWYKPMASSTDERFDVFARQAQYKKYDTSKNNNFYDLINDPMEQHPLTNLTNEQKQIKAYLNSVIKKQSKYNGRM
jgi:arylsulfatase A